MVQYANSADRATNIVLYDIVCFSRYCGTVLYQYWGTVKVRRVQALENDSYFCIFSIAQVASSCVALLLWWPTCVTFSCAYICWNSPVFYCQQYLRRLLLSQIKQTSRCTEIQSRCTIRIAPPGLCFACGRGALLRPGHSAFLARKVIYAYNYIVWHIGPSVAYHPELQYNNVTCYWNAIRTCTTPNILFAVRFRKCSQIKVDFSLIPYNTTFGLASYLPTSS